MKDTTVTIFFNNGKPLKIDLAENAWENDLNTRASQNGKLQEIKELIPYSKHEKKKMLL